MKTTNHFAAMSLAAATIAAPLGIGTAPAWAQEAIPVTAPPASPSMSATTTVPELVIAGHVVMRLRATAGGMTPEERAYSLTQRIGPILTLPNLSATDVQVHQLHPGRTASIYVRDRLLVTVDRNLAAANNTSVDALAEQWARNLRATLPQVNVAVRLSGGTSWSASSSMPPENGMIRKKP